MQNARHFDRNLFVINTKSEAMTASKKDGEKLYSYLELNLVNKSELIRVLRWGRARLYQQFKEPVMKPGSKKAIADALGVNVGEIWPDNVISIGQSPAEKSASIQSTLDKIQRDMHDMNERMIDMDRRVKNMEVARLKERRKPLKFNDK